MIIPLPIPHPVCIAIEIYNRDSDDPIPLDNDFCWDILKAVEESNGEIQVSLNLFSIQCQIFSFVSMILMCALLIVRIFIMDDNLFKNIDVHF